MAAQREWFDTDYYSVLGIGPEASAKEITRGYRKLARELHFALTEMSDDTADDRPPTPPSGPPELQLILSFQEQQEVHPPSPPHPTFPPHRARAAEPGILELCSRFSRV